MPFAIPTARKYRRVNFARVPHRSRKSDYVFRHPVRRSRVPGGVVVHILWDNFGVGRCWEPAGDVDSGHFEADAERHQLLHRKLGSCRHHHRVVLYSVSGKYFVSFFR